MDEGGAAVAKRHPGDPADDADDERLTHDLPDDPAAAPPHRLERAELADPARASALIRAGNVKMLAIPNAAARTATASHLPRLLARLDALDSDPVTWLARSLEVVTVALGSAPEISFETVLMSAELVADT